VDRECHVGGHILAVTPLSSRLCGEGKVEVKQEASSVIQAVAAANRELSDRHTEDQEQEEDEAARYDRK